MPETTDSSRTAAAPEPSTPMGLKAFNSVGREDSTYEVLKPQVSPAQRRRTMLLLAFLIVMAVAAAGIAFGRSHLTFNPNAENGRQFAVPQGGPSD